MDKLLLEEFYFKKQMSMSEIAKYFSVSVNKIKYWMDKYQIQARNRSEAVYLKNNPSGDPFSIKKPQNISEAILYGMGIGLYWGEGTKADKGSVRLGNADPKLIEKFINFLETFYKIKRSDLRFGLQIFTDITEKEAIDFWMKSLKIKGSQFYKIQITRSSKKGTYRHKLKYGVLTVYYHNKKLRDIVFNLLPT